MRFGLNFNPFFFIFDGKFIGLALLMGLAFLGGIIYLPFMVLHGFYLASAAVTTTSIFWVFAVVAIGIFVRLGRGLGMLTFGLSRIVVGGLIMGALLLFSWIGTVGMSYPGEQQTFDRIMNHAAAHPGQRTASITGNY
jgi:hypothetical protein